MRQTEYAGQHVAARFGHNRGKTGAEANRYDTGENLAFPVILLTDSVAQCMASLQLSQAGRNEQADQDVLSRVRQTYAEKQPPARKAPSDKTY
jgi:hypothetical protein